MNLMITVILSILILFIIVWITVSYIKSEWNIKKATILKIGIPILIILTLLNRVFSIKKLVIVI